MGVRIPPLLLNIDIMSLLDSEENIFYEAEMAFDITHAYLIEVMSFSWRRNFREEIDIYEKKFLGDSKIKIKHYYGAKYREHSWVLSYNLPNRRLPMYSVTTIYKVRDIYKVYKRIREVFLNMHRI